MLVLTRRAGEQIVIGNDIRVTVVSVGPGRVKIGIEAPSDVRVDRQEVHERIATEQATTAPAPAADEPLIVGDEAPKLHNRIVDKFPAPAVPPPAAVSPNAESTASRIMKHRLPRKPR